MSRYKQKNLSCFFKNRSIVLQLAVTDMRNFLQIEDHQGAEIIQRSCVGCLAHLLAPSLKWTQFVILRSMERLGRLAREMCFDEYTSSDLLLVVCHRVDFPGNEQAAIAGFDSETVGTREFFRFKKMAMFGQ